MPEVHHGLEGVVAFETQIAEPDKEGSALRYRGVDIEDLAGRVPFENVWGLLIDGSFTPGLPPAEAYSLPVHTGDVRVDVQAAIAMLAPAFGFGQTYDITDEQARADLAPLVCVQRVEQHINVGGRRVDAGLAVVNAQRPNCELTVPHEVEPAEMPGFRGTRPFLNQACH